MIQVCELAKRYGSTVAVDGLSFTVHPGRVTGFLGPNGAGKSTTMRAILGLDAPTAGWATVNGQPYQRLARPLRQAGALLDAGAVYGGRTARDHLLAIAASNGIGARRVAEVLGLVGLESAAGRRVRGFSLGMKQRLGIAGALLGDPPVLMFDLAGLLAAQGASVTAQPEGGLAVTGLEAAAIGEVAREHGIALHELTPRHASLEEAFMELTRDSVDYRTDVPGYAGRAA